MGNLLRRNAHRRPLRYEPGENSRGSMGRENGYNAQAPNLCFSESGMVVERVESAPAVHSVYCERLAVGIAIPRRETSHSTKRLSDRRRLLF